jgi:hypothetical protein
MNELNLVVNLIRASVFAMSRCVASLSRKTLETAFSLRCLLGQRLDSRQQGTPDHPIGSSIWMARDAVCNRCQTPPQPDDFLANRAMTLRRQCSARKALVPKIGAMHIGQR